MNDLDDVFESDIDDRQAELLIADNDYIKSNEKISKVFFLILYFVILFRRIFKRKRF